MKKFLIYIITITILLPFSFCNAEEMKITSFSPSSGKIGSTVTIIGENFSKINNVFFKSSSGSDISSSILSVNGTSLTTVVPVGAVSGKIKIEISTGGVNSTLLTPTDFQIEIGSALFDFSPKEGKVGDEVVLSSNGGFSGVSSVSFGGGVSAIPITNNKNFIQITVPEGAKTGNLIIKTNSGDITSSSNFVVKSSSGSTTGGTETTSSSSNNSSGDKIVDKTSGTYIHPTIEFNGIVPVCNVGSINENTGDYDNNCDFDDLMALVNKFINFVLVTLATPLFAIIIIYVGIIYLTSGGSENKVSSAKKIMQNALFGYIIALSAWLIIKTILITFGYVDVTKWF